MRASLPPLKKTRLPWFDEEALVEIERRYAQRLKTGDLFLWLVALLSPGLFLFDLFRADRRMLVAGLSVGQAAAIVILAASLIWISARHRRGSGPIEVT